MGVRTTSEEGERGSIPRNRSFIRCAPVRPGRKDESCLGVPSTDKLSGFELNSWVDNVSRSVSK